MTAEPRLQIAAIAFDLGNVLVRVDHFRFCRGLAELVKLTPEAVYQATFDSGLEPAFDTGRLSSREFYRRIMVQFRLSLSYPQFCALWNEIFEPLEGMEEVVARLAPRYSLFLVSNTNPLHFHYIRASYPLLRHFRRFILSYQVGSRKPEAGIYQALIQATGRSPEHILFLDDKLLFVEAARAHGLVAWHFSDLQEFHRQLSQHGFW